MWFMTTTVERQSRSAVVIKCEYTKANARCMHVPLYTYFNVVGYYLVEPT